jgi:5-carboxymethyl-2-hydroxymuconate isomerase
MAPEVVALIVIAVFQAVQTLLMAMGTFIIKDMRDRITRLETLEMGKGIKTHG